jgi:TonB family protein
MSNERGRGWGCILLTLLLVGLLGTGAAMADDSTGLHPTLVGRVAPYYPPEAIHLRHEGTTLVHISVDAQGVLHDVTVLKSSGYAELDQAALTAVNQWKYQPAVDHGMAVDSEMQVPVTFKIKFADAEDNTQGGSRLSASQAAQVDAHFRQMDEASAKVQQSSLLAKQALAKKYADSGQAEHRFRRSLNILLVLTTADGLLLRLYPNRGDSDRSQPLQA